MKENTTELMSRLRKLLNGILLKNSSGTIIFLSKIISLVILLKILNLSLRNECIIQHAFKHDYILDIFYPPVAAIVQPDTASIETIVVSKYGWGKTTEAGREKRNLFDLLMEIREKR